jgi:hypothetical protein
MLEDMAGGGSKNIVSWQPHGKAFRVHQPEVFAGRIIPRYFKQSKYKSFQRQLNIYGFRRILKGLDKGAYYHTLFIRNKKSMSLRMTRQIIKGTAGSNDAGIQDPQFYSETAAEDQHPCNSSDTRQDRRRDFSEISLSNSYPDTTATTPVRTSTSSHGSAGCWEGGMAETILSKYSSFNKSNTLCNTKKKKNIQSAGGTMIINTTKKEETCFPSDDGGDKVFGKNFFVVHTSDFSSLVNDGKGPVNYMPRSA